MPISRRERNKILAAILLVGILMLVVVAIKAYSTQLQFEINSTQKRIQDCERQIQNLQVKIRSANNINNLEARALEMGLIYPDFSQIVYLREAQSGGEELALALKETVYGQ
ncbi:MAG: hypothetical protein IJJ75_05100 [Firmicutes bacterium]|nr:hypothetical protein [Bacillota bacterium]MBQ5436610.1 hypothetical protein [Bacillota bacterium]MBR0522550.1 hypothetical protein [Bacillota bacterium]